MAKRRGVDQGDRRTSTRAARACHRAEGSGRALAAMTRPIRPRRPRGDPAGRCPVYRAPVRLGRTSPLRENRHVHRAGHRDLRHLEPELRGCDPAGAGARHQEPARGDLGLDQGAAGQAGTAGSSRTRSICRSPSSSSRDAARLARDPAPAASPVAPPVPRAPPASGAGAPDRPGSPEELHAAPDRPCCFTVADRGRGEALLRRHWVEIASAAWRGWPVIVALQSPAEAVRAAAWLWALRPDWRLRRSVELVDELETRGLLPRLAERAKAG
jgi:hypothetical protein